MLEVKVNLEEVVEFVKNGEDCKVEVSADGKAYVITQEAQGYDDTILVQNFDSYDYEECESEEEYIAWLIDSYKSEELEANNGELIKIEFEK